MALAFSNLTSGTAGTGANNSTTNPATASITPTANALILVSLLVYDITSNVAPSSVSGNGITYTLVNNSLDFNPGSGPARVYLYRGMSSSPSSGAITFTGSFDLVAWRVTEVTGADTGGTNGSAAVVQSAVANTNTDTTLTVTLAAFASASNGAFGTMYHYNGQTVTQGTGWTELADAASTPQTQYRLDNDTTCDWSFTSSAAGAVAIEIAVSGGGGGSSIAAIANYYRMLRG